MQKEQIKLDVLQTALDKRQCIVQLATVQINQQNLVFCRSQSTADRHLLQVDFSLQVDLTVCSSKFQNYTLLSLIVGVHHVHILNKNVPH